jgi:single-strand DNA-binding protein
MVSLNRIMLIGNVGTDPEMRFTPSTVVAWKKQAESCNQFLTKGQRVYVEGSLRTRSWEGRDGQKRVAVEVIANRVLFLDRQAVAPLPGEEAPVEATVEASEEEVAPEDLPF